MDAHFKPTEVGDLSDEQLAARISRETELLSIVARGSSARAVDATFARRDALVAEQRRRREVAARPDAYRQLGMIEDYAVLASSALRDEHEANFTHYVRELAGLARQLEQLVDAW